MSFHSTFEPPSTISSIIICTSFGSTPFTLMGWGMFEDGPPSGVRDRGGGVLRPVLPFRIGDAPGI